MTRISTDQYKLSDGQLVTLDFQELPPEGAILWNGYDYDNQYWVHEGKRDTRTIEELRIASNS